MGKALIAMSGGVDSSLAAKLVADAGYDCVGCTMRLYGESNLGDIEDARQIAQKLGMPFHVFDFVGEFQDQVISRFVCAYERGITPNPCIDCNRYMKFGKLFDCAKDLGCDHVATGHYARVEERDGEFFLKKALDPAKDQSYVLYSLTQDQLAHTLFPLGAMRKTDVRALAESSGFANAEKPESQDICFVPDRDYGAFLERHTGKTYAPGPFLDTAGNVLGTHRGTVHYTVGQRKGLGIALGKPVYVKSIDAEANTVTLAEDCELFSDSLAADDFNWISGKAPSAPVGCKAKVRYRQTEQPATAIPQADGTVRVVFDQPQRAIAPGQAVVLYDGDIVLGGGRIL